MKLPPTAHKELTAVAPERWLELNGLCRDLDDAGVLSVEEIHAQIHQQCRVFWQAQNTTLLMMVRLDAAHAVADDALDNWRAAWVQTSTVADSKMRKFRRLLSALNWDRQRLSDRDTGTFRSGTISVEDYEELGMASHARFARWLGAHHRLLFVTPVAENVEAYVIVSRGEHEGRFSADAVNEALAASRVFELHLRRWCLLLGALHDHRLLTPRERDVLVGLLRGLSEKECAEVIGLRASSVHQVAVAVYRKFSVNSRGELMSEFFKRQASNTRAVWTQTRVDMGAESKTADRDPLETKPNATSSDSI